MEGLEAKLEQCLRRENDLKAHNNTLQEEVNSLKDLVKTRNMGVTQELVAARSDIATIKADVADVDPPLVWKTFRCLAEIQAKQTETLMTHISGHHPGPADAGAPGSTDAAIAPGSSDTDAGDSED